MSCNAVIVDYGTGNVSSIRRALSRIGSLGTISSDARDIARCDKLILSGVGHFRSAMNGIRKNRLEEPLHQAVVVEKKPVLGICLGMELFAKRSDEGDSNGLGWIDAEVVRFSINDPLKHKIPHIGWNRVRSTKSSPLMKKIPDNSEFYFLHSYYLKLVDRSDMLNESRYEMSFPAAIEKGNIFGVQYHPEKSHDIGLQLLRNFIDL